MSKAPVEIPKDFLPRAATVSVTTWRAMTTQQKRWFASIHPDRAKMLQQREQQQRLNRSQAQKGRKERS